MRINGFEQMKAFYSWVFDNQDKGVRPQHISLYLFLINQNNRNNWVEWFKCPFDLAMHGAAIGNKKTYYNCLYDLQEWNLITYQRGVNEWKAPLIRVEVLKCTSAVPQSEPQGTPLPTPQGTPQGTQSNITSNHKPVTGNRGKKKFTPPTLNEFEKYFTENEFTPEYARHVFKYYNDADWVDGKGNQVLNWKQKVRGVWFKDEHKKPKQPKDERSKYPDLMKLYK